MLTPQDIMERLKEMVEEAFPGEAVYLDLVTSESQRPSTLIALEEYEGEVHFSTGGVELRPVITMTTFVEVDEYHHSHLAELHRRQARLVGLLLSGYIRIGDRAPKIAKPIKLGGGYDYDTVTVTFGYTLSRKDFLAQAQVPLMERLQIREEVRTYE